MHHRTRRPSRRDGGFTLIEVLVAVILLAIVITPLTGAFISSLRTTKQVDDRLVGSAAAQRIASWWTRDVQSVDRGGVNPVGICGGSAGVEQHLVSFASDQLSTSTGLPTKTSWVVEGSGDRAQLIRRSCVGDQAAQRNVLAESFLEDGQDVLQAIKGPVAGSPLLFCDGRACTIVVDGTYDYSLKVQRRVPDLSGAATQLPPGAPTISALAARNTYLSVGWTPPTLQANQPAITSYRAHLYTDQNGEPVQTKELAGPGTTSARFEGLSNGTSYFVRVQAANEVGWGPLSIVGGPAVPGPTAPDEPTITSVTPQDGAAAVTWTPPTNNGGSDISSWKLYAKPAAGGNDIGPVNVAGGSATSGTMTGLTNGTEYVVWVVAINPNGDGTPSANSVPVTPYGAPAPPTQVTAEARESGAVVTWPAVTDGNGRPVTGYRVRAYRDGETSPQRTITVNGASTTSATLAPASGAALDNGRPYRFRVATISEASTGQDSDLSNTVRTFPQSPSVVPSVAPGPPTALSASAFNLADRSITVTHGSPNSDGGAAITHVRYVLQRANVGSTTWTEVSTVTPAFDGGPGSRTYSNLAGPYDYRIQVSYGNRGEWFAAGDPVRWGSVETTPAVRALTAATAPTNVSLSRPGGSFGTQLTLSFGAPSSDGGGAITGYSYSCTATNGTPVSGTVGTAGNHTISGLRDGRSYSCTVRATTAAGNGTIATTGTATPYGECRLNASEDTWIDDESAGSNKGGDSQLEVARNGAWYEAGAESNAWAFMRFNYGGACTNGQTMAGSAYLATANLTVRVTDSGTNRTHGLDVVNGGWSEYGLTWNNRPSIGSRLHTWSASGSGERTRDVVGTARAQKTGTNNGFAIRDAGGSDYNFMAKYGSREGGNPAYLTITFYTQGA